MNQTHLFLGGPADGQQRVVEHPTDSSGPTTFVKIASTPSLSPGAKSEVVEYQAHLFFDLDRTRHFVYVESSIQGPLGRLIDGYQKPSKKPEPTSEERFQGIVCEMESFLVRHPSYGFELMHQLRKILETRG